MYNEIEIIKQLLARHRQINIEGFLSVARKWMPSSEYYSYEEEMTNRVAYLNGNMTTDMRAEIRRRYPQTYKDIERDQVNVRFYQYLIEQRSGLFKKRGKIFLVDKSTGERVDPGDISQVNLDKMINDGNFWHSMKDINRYEEACSRVAAKAWWDDRRGCVRVDVRSPNNVYIIPDSAHYWDIDKAHCVAFIVPGIDGVNSLPRYEIWSILRAEDDRVPLGITTLHYYTSKHSDQKINDDDSIPFVDPTTSQPIYPFVWIQGDVLPELYHLKNCDALAINRSLNMIFTDIRYGYHYQMHPTMILEAKEDTGNLEPPSNLTVGPAEIVTIPPGYTFRFATPSTNYAEARDFCSLLAHFDASVGNVNPQVLFGESAQAESGIALKIKNRALEEKMQDKKDIYKPQIEELIRRACIVNDYYSDNKIRPDERNLKIVLEYAVADRGEEDAEIISNSISLISKHVETAIDLRMKLYDETRQEAEQNVRGNMEVNKELTGGGFVGFGQPSMVDRITQFNKDKEQQKEKKEDQEEEEEEKQEAK